MRQKQVRATGGYVQVIALVVVIIVIAAAVFVFLNRNNKADVPVKQSTNLSAYCVGGTFSIGNLGHCVSAIQTMTNYMENSGLTQCPFIGAETLPVNDTYDAPTGAQVRAVQQWAVCYARQEGFTTNIAPTGTVDKATWGELCTYSYTNPSHNGASGAAAAIISGKDAGCAQLQT